MEPDVIRMYSSSPPPLEDGEEEDDFGDFDGFSSVPHSVSLTEFDTPTTFNQVQALNATSPPELLNNGRVAGHPSTAPHTQEGDQAKANVVLSGGRHSSCPSERTVGETKKALSCGQLPVDCNGEGPEVLTNGFKMLDVQGIPSLQNSVNSCRTGASPEDTEAVPPESRDDEFADFAAFADVGASDSPTAHTAEVSHSPFGGCSLREGPSPVYSNIDQGITLEGDMEEAHRVGLDGSESVSSCELPDVPSSQQQSGLSDTKSKQPDCLPEHLNTFCTTTEMLALNGFCDDRAEETAGSGEDCTPQERTGKEKTTERSVEEATGKGTETRTSLDLDPPELCGDPSTTGLGPSALPQEDSAAPNHHSPTPEDQDVGFRGFDGGDGFSDQDFAHFDQLDVQVEHGLPSTQSTADQQVPGDQEDEDFGDFNTQRFEPAGTEEEQEEGEESLPLEDSNYNSNDDKDRGQLTEFPGSDSFGNFSSVAVDVAPQAGAGWSAFSEEAGPADEDSWAAFDGEQGSTPEVQEEWSTPEAPPPTSDHPNSRTEVHSQVALSGHVERLFQQSFPGNPVTEVEEKVPPLKCLLEPTEEPGGAPQGPGKGPRTTPPNGALRANVWRQLLDIHEAFGLRHQWGGSHSNKTLLCSLGIDTRNILFTGQKKQAIIVPMYAASLGMLEPTKEPVKPISAAEMITSIAQAPPLGTEKSPCPDTAQEALPPVQFDWSSSGLTNPLDASGGSSLLNLDFFGPVEDSGPSSSTSIPGVDPELYELTTAKLDSTGSGRRVVDAFARLMSTMEKTSTSARKPKKEEHLSAEAAKVMADLPDLSFMQAKVLMFPTTLTPLGCSRATPD
ncbi:aftiphilin a isoform X2 [Gadus macrocephalus]|uniref:aftiphilin a isoform X2 n=1 Tax=Gadus macrocephalus TaxID=80720 RepID=UPI0028CB9749|nr:aftiphilin a isoform X2 [Gadus macrocephalus]